MKRLFQFGALILCGACAAQKTEVKPAATSAAPERQTPESGISGEQQEAVENVFRRKAPELMSCWNDEYEKTHDRKIEGDVTLSMTITAQGKATRVSVLHSTLNNKDIEGCMTTAVTTWTFPEGTIEIPYRRTVHIGAQF